MVFAGAADESYQGPEFDPIIPLPDEVEVKTGEEEEEILFETRCKLYRYTENQWKERGSGNIKILWNKQTDQARVVMRREQVQYPNFSRSRFRSTFQQLCAVVPCFLSGDESLHEPLHHPGHEDRTEVSERDEDSDLDRPGLLRDECRSYGEFLRKIQQRGYCPEFQGLEILFCYYFIFYSSSKNP